MARASYTNQARVHNGYHYPRSVLTALRSRVNFPTFVEEYGEAVVSNFDKYYAIAKNLSKVNAKQFQLFCQKIGAEVDTAPKEIKDKFNPFMVEDVFKVREYAFNSHILRDMLLKKIDAKVGIEYRNNEEVMKLAQNGEGLTVTSSSGVYTADHVINCGYSQLNKLNKAAGLPSVPLKHEIAEMCLVQLPEHMKDFSITVMDGPFFSIMPFPSRGLHTLSHVRYTPHTEWRDTEGEGDQYRDPHAYLAKQNLKSNYAQMYADVVRYIPALKDMRYADSIWETKTVLIQSEDDDSRPILFKPHFGLYNYTCIMGGKLDNIYDVFQELDLLYGGQENN